jgi:hypothetical protein
MKSWIEAGTRTPANTLDGFNSSVAKFALKLQIRTKLELMPLFCALLFALFLGKSGITEKMCRFCVAPLK